MQIILISAAAVILFILLTFVVLLALRLRYQLKTVGELKYFLGQDDYEYILIDIRSSQYYKKGHLPGAVNVSYPDCLDYLPTENMFEKIYVYGKSLRRSRLVAKMMSDTGYFNVSYFTFGVWKGPLEKF